MVFLQHFEIYHNIIYYRFNAWFSSKVLKFNIPEIITTSLRYGLNIYEILKKNFTHRAKNKLYNIISKYLQGKMLDTYN